MPWLTLNVPPPELKVNRTMGAKYWSYRRAKKAYQSDCQNMALTGERGWKGIPVIWPTILRVYMFLAKSKSADISDVGSWLKPGIDALTDYLVWPNDSPRYFSEMKVRVLHDWGNPRVDLYWGDDERTLALEALAIPQRIVKARVNAKP